MGDYKRHKAERERKGVRGQGEGGGGYLPTEKRKKERELMFVAKDSWSLGAGLQRERLGTIPRSQKTELGSRVLLPNPGRGQERPKGKDE